jgi:hypothetical protein
VGSTRLNPRHSRDGRAGAPDPPQANPGGHEHQHLPTSRHGARRRTRSQRTECVFFWEERPDRKCRPARPAMRGGLACLLRASHTREQWCVPGRADTFFGAFFAPCGVPGPRSTNIRKNKQKAGRGRKTRFKNENQAAPRRRFRAPCLQLSKYESPIPIAAYWRTPKALRLHK